MNKLLVICGPTATGKTDLGVYLAKKFNGEIISADSRQVYKGMDIGTGKNTRNMKHEIRDMKEGRCWKTEDGVKIWGYDLVSPNEDFSVSQFENFAREKIPEIYKKNKLPILVGGTGFYIKAVLEGVETSQIPINEKLREELEEKDVDELYEKLLSLNKKRALLLNESDRSNPRRLVRAIEVETSGPKSLKENTVKYDSLVIGLTSDLKYLHKRIEKSVERRIEKGFEKEVKTLIESGYGLKHKAMSATGYKEMVDYLNGVASTEETISLWTKREKQYVKRQLTWFKKQPDIHWFNISDANFRIKVEELVTSWENNINESQG